MNERLNVLIRLMIKQTAYLDSVQRLLCELLAASGKLTPEKEELLKHILASETEEFLHVCANNEDSLGSLLND